jgi:hypothetical protein
MIEQFPFLSGLFVESQLVQIESINGLLFFVNQHFGYPISTK